MSNTPTPQAAPALTDEQGYPPLPKPDVWDYQKQAAYYLSETMRAYVDADRAQRTAWRPIAEGPKERAPMIVVRGVLASGYVTDPWCVWWQDGAWQRWPHKEAPTVWLPLPPLPTAPKEQV